jgi:hypothetical protein
MNVELEEATQGGQEAVAMVEDTRNSIIIIINLQEITL